MEATGESSQHPLVVQDLAISGSGTPKTYPETHTNYDSPMASSDDEESQR